MRFGITPLDFVNVFNIISEGGKLDYNRFDLVDIIRFTHDQGFSLMELTMDLRYTLLGGMTEQTVMALQTVKEELNLTFTAHLPLWAIEPACPNQYIRQASVECLVDAVNLVKPLDPEVYVLHATGALAAEFSQLDLQLENMSTTGGTAVLGRLQAEISQLQLKEVFQQLVRKNFTDYAEQSVLELLNRTGISSQKLALENVEFPFEATWQLAERLNTSICCDTGHLLAGYSGSINVLEFVERYFDRIREIHLHDGGQYSIGNGHVHRVDHLVLGTGQLPITEFMTQLQEQDYQGAIIFELNLRDAKKSIEIIRQHLPGLPIE